MRVDPKLDKLGAAWMDTVIEVTKHPLEGGKYASLGLTEELGEEHLQILQDPSRKFRSDMYFIWARKV